METLNPSIYIPEHLRDWYKDLTPATPASSGLDLIVPSDLFYTAEKPFQIVDFQVVVKAPEGYHTVLMPRSSTFKTWRIIQTNGIGLIDADYCGREDHLKMPTLWLPGEGSGMLSMVIPAGTRLAQIIFEKAHTAKFSFFLPEDKSRGGIGSTGVGI